MANVNYSEITPELIKLSEHCVKNGMIDPELYGKYEVKRGLRDINGKGVLAGLTEIGEIRSYIIEDSEMIPCEGKLFYRGIDIEEIVKGFISENRYGFEEVTYLLLFGDLPSQQELDSFKKLLAYYRTLPTSFVRDIIMKAPSNDMMNTLARTTVITMKGRACSFTPLSRNCPPRKIFSLPSVQTASTRRWKQRFWTLLWCFMPSMGVETTPPSPPMS